MLVLENQGGDFSLMPLQRVGDGWRWGSQGKIYRGKGARLKALLQGRAIEASKRRRQ
jgi:hypothetical protein